MLDQIQQYISENLNSGLIAVGLLVLTFAAYFYFRGNLSSQRTPTMPSHDLDGMETMNTVCDLATGICHPQEHMQQMHQELAAEGFSGEQIPQEQLPEQQTTM